MMHTKTATALHMVRCNCMYHRFIHFSYDVTANSPVECNDTESIVELMGKQPNTGTSAHIICMHIIFLSVPGQSLSQQACVVVVVFCCVVIVVLFCFSFYRSFRKLSGCIDPTTVH